MDTINHVYNGKSWKANPTVSDKNSFFHAAFGKRVDGKGPYLDKLVKFRRSRWATFLSRFQNETMPPLVADTLQKCFSANEKYKQLSVENQDHFEGYILDITSAVYDVTMEEIVILATLENARVILFKAGESKPVVIVDPDTEVFASYLYMEEPKGDVILHLEGNVFSRMNPVLDSVIKYKKGGTAGIEGVRFQVELLTVFLLNALQKLTDWQLSTENTAAGKFDDVVMEWPDGATLLQAKYRENKTKKITLEELLATNSKNDNFSIAKYFLSYINVKKTFKVREVIICTNASVDIKAMEFLKAQKVDPESLLHYDNRDCQFYTFNDDILPQLMENVKNYYEKNSQNEGVDISMITEKNIKIFLRHLQLFFNYPAGKVIERLLFRIKHLENVYDDISHSDIYNKMLDWFRQEKGECMTELYAKAIFSEIERDKHWRRLEKYKISFQCNNLDFLISENSKRLFHFVVEGGSLLQEINILQTLHSNQTKFLFVNPSDVTEKYKQVEAFHLPKYTILVLVWPKVAEDEVGCKLKDILDKFEYKKVVLIADRSNEIPQLSRLSQDNCHINEPITLRDLSKDSQERILQKKNIKFQGRHVSLKEVLADQANEDYAKFLNTEELEKLVRGEMINVGTPILELDEHIKQSYIKRKFKKEIKNNEKEKGEEEIFSEELICEMRKKVVLISDSAGTGKSTVLTNLAGTVKSNYPHLWVIRIDLNDHTQILNEFLRKNRKSINILELLDSKDATKLTNQLERSVFSMNAKVVLMLDGFDEISPDYTQLVLSLLSHSQKQQNFAKVIVTTRPHMAQELKDKFQVESFVLEPFVKQNQIDFLVSYWMHNLKPDNNQRAKCEKYANALINKMSSWVRLFKQGANHFAALPLHVRMIAEIFEENNQFEMSDEWEGCKQYLVGDGIEPKLPENMDVTKLYKMFIEKKRNVFVDKENPSGKTAVNLALKNMFEECQEYHKNLAIELILGKRKCKLFSCRRQTARNLEINMLKIGIVQKVDNIFQFAHRTYAEYFVAESLIEELQLPNENIEFQKFLIEKILLSAPIDIVHVFFNSFLQQMINKLSPNTFCKYQCVSYKIAYFNARKCYLINKIVKFGHLAIFQLILKCVDINSFTKKLKVPMQFFQTPIGESIPEYSNILNVVQQEMYVESKFIPNTFLDHAAKGGHLEMVKFLVEQGANLNIGKFKPLQVVVDSGNFEVLKFLVEKGADVNAKDTSHQTALYRAFSKNDFTMVTYLLDRTLSIDDLYPFSFGILCRTAFFGRIDILEKLMERGLNINSRGKNDETILFWVVQGGQLETIRYLVQRGCNINGTDFGGNTVLHVISIKPSLLSAAELLLDLGIDVNVINVNYLTALHIAVQNNNFHLAELLVNHGAYVNLEDMGGNTALHLAAEKLLGNIMKFLVKHSANINSKNKDDCTALYLSIKEYCTEENKCLNVKNLDLIKFLIESGGDVNIKYADGSTVLHLAAKMGNLDIVNLLMEFGVDADIMNNNGQTALHVAALGTHRHIVKFLMQHNADSNIRDIGGQTVFRSSIDLRNCNRSNDRCNVLKLITEKAEDINLKDNHGLTALHLATMGGDIDAVNLLVELGADVNISDAMEAVLNGFLDFMTYFLERCRGINITDKDGNTALHLAVHNNSLYVVEFFVNIGIDLNVKNNDGCTALHVAVDRDRLCIANFLVEQGAHLNLADNWGSTALHLATCCSLDFVIFLVERGADIHLEDSNGDTAGIVAKKKGRIDVFNYLQKVLSLKNRLFC